MYKIIITVFIIISLSSLAFASPFKCNREGVFDDKNTCNTFCSRPCDELMPKAGGNACDTSKYKNFVYVNDKTYALTKSTVTWESENTANIRDETDNKIIAGLLKTAGITEAWIGVYDPTQSSTAYGVIDTSRFKTKSGITPKYTSWKEGEPNNALNSASIGNSPLYGEYWAVIDQNGKWNDTGLTESGQHQLRHAVVEWNGELSCVAGKENNVSDGKPTGMVCGKEDDKLGFNFQTCSEGGIFGGGSGFLCPLEKTACNRNEKEIITDETRSANFIFPSLKEYQVKNAKPTGQNVEFHAPVMCSTNNGDFPRYQGEYTELTYGLLIQNIGGGKINVTISASQSIILPSNECWGGGTINYTPYSNTFSAFEGSEIINPLLNFTLNSATNTIKEGETLNTGLIGSSSDYVQNFTLTATIRNRSKEISFTCPHSGKACVDNGGSYYCSPLDCSQGSSGGSYDPNTDETPQGTNDADNNGATDADGNCLGIVKIFPGNDGRCRLPGTQSKFFQCCKLLNPDEVDKPDIILFPDVLDFKVCNGSERQLAVNRAKDMCVEIGKYCAEKWQGSGCVQYKKSYCCFASDFIRAYSEAGMDMLGKSWGTPESPYCGGFTTQEMQYLSGAGIKNHPKLKEYGEKLGNELEDKLMNEFEKGFDKNTIGNQIQDQIKELQ